MSHRCCLVRLQCVARVSRGHAPKELASLADALFTHTGYLQTAPAPAVAPCPPGPTPHQLPAPPSLSGVQLSSSPRSGPLVSPGFSSRHSSHGPVAVLERRDLFKIAGTLAKGPRWWPPESPSPVRPTPVTPVHVP